VARILPNTVWIHELSRIHSLLSLGSL